MTDTVQQFKRVEVIIYDDDARTKTVVTGIRAMSVTFDSEQEAAINGRGDVVYQRITAITMKAKGVVLGDTGVYYTAHVEET